MAKQHDPDCEYHRSATCTTPVECEHGRDVCPTCDPCTCKPPMPETTKELVAWLQDVEGAPGFTPEWTEKIRAAAARLEELERIVERLPTTADGVTIGLGDNFYFVQDSEVVRAGVVGLTRAVIDSDAYVDHVSYHDEDGCEDGLPSGSCYSTKGAAEAARGKA